MKDSCTKQYDSKDRMFCFILTSAIHCLTRERQKPGGSNLGGMITSLRARHARPCWAPVKWYCPPNTAGTHPFIGHQFKAGIYVLAIIWNLLLHHRTQCLLGHVRAHFHGFAWSPIAHCVPLECGVYFENRRVGLYWELLATFHVQCRKVIKNSSACTSSFQISLSSTSSFQIWKILLQI